MASFYDLFQQVKVQVRFHFRHQEGANQSLPVGDVIGESNENFCHKNNIFLDRVRKMVFVKTTSDLEIWISDLYPSIETLDSPLDSLSFYRRFVSPNRPVVIRNAISHWPALNKWSRGYFRQTIGDLEVTVAVTPNGYADAIYEKHFVMPEERRMCMSKFLDILSMPARERERKGIFYIQKQNSNLSDEFACLMRDVDPDISWGSKAFGNKPDAVNFWMGDEQAVTSMHRDHYENLYCVVSGQKTFTLLPPTDLPFIPYETYPAATYKEREDGEFDIVKEDNGSQVSWIAVDPLKPDLDLYPDYAKARPFTVTVNAGEMLYLPSLWFHHVQQSHACIAVNYWYDMDFDIKWAYYKFLERLTAEVTDSRGEGSSNDG